MTISCKVSKLIFIKKSDSCLFRNSNVQKMSLLLCLCTCGRCEQYCIPEKFFETVRTSQFFLDYKKLRKVKKKKEDIERIYHTYEDRVEH